MSEKFRQDLPPEGGYPKFNWSRTYPKIFWTPGRTMLFSCILPTFYGYFHNFRHTPLSIKTQYFEDHDISNALEPFMMAERDRQVLRIMKRNRELEEEVMKDEPGWKTGTWYGEPIYFTLGDNWIEPLPLEINAHLKEKDQPYNYYWRLITAWPRRWN
uniref:NADH dehydrogenase [ubiquinone] 1 alpha subcomplex subunit 13 n=1 Tax=Globodera rostochiensis TaxID=31243 RepID=A0A914I9R6_GLORO